MRRLALLACLPACLLAAPGMTQIYKVTDDDQGVVFTDRPETMEGTGHSSVEEVELQDLNTVTPVEVRPRPLPSASAADEEEAVEATVTITSPANESTIAMGPGNFAVSASPDPALERGERLVLMIDGQPHGTEQTTGSWFVEGALRGPHDLIVQRKGPEGATVAISETVRVYVLRPSVIRR